MPINISPVDSLPNVPDSAKVMLQNIAQTIASDPDKFLQDLLRDAISFGLKVVAAFLVYIIGAWLIKRVKGVLRRIFEKRNTEKTIASFINSLVTISLTVLLVIITVGTLGVNTTSLAAVLAAGGMAIGMALSGTVQNFAGGIMILMFKPFKAGDYIEALGYSGKVAEVNIVSTKLRTFDNRTIILPNGSLSNGNINNYFEHSVNRLEWLVSVEYATDNEKAKEVMMGILKSDPRILDSSTDGAADPFVALNALKDSSVEYTMKAWVKVEDYWDVKYSINEAIFTELPKNGINFPFPQLDVHVKN
ncbi:MAG: mechanosensitive ion channel [Candidatus Cryptobacteroides sp.]|nr:mechanosensitive ion channel [Bacteroidales bacterium]MDY3963005.1 mechanosensitive ion channel [Candidatus Cryptobacteroides sp.]